MISGILNSGVEGLNRSRQGLDQSAKDIVNAGNQVSNQLNNVEADLSSSDGVASIEEAAVDLKIYELQFGASAKVVETADKMAGTLIDELA
jgi:hypothetical protein